MFSLRKRAPIESLFNFHQTYVQLPFARTSPSTFLFLLSSQCQRADQATSRPQRHVKASAFRNPGTKQTRPRLPGNQARLCQKHQNCGSDNRSTSSSAAGCRQVQMNCQHPISRKWAILNCFKSTNFRPPCSQQHLVRLPGRAAALSESVDQWERLRSTSFNEAGSRIGAGMCQRPGESFCVRAAFSGLPASPPVDNTTDPVA